jgi:hypothetical protein
MLACEVNRIRTAGSCPTPVTRGHCYVSVLHPFKDYETDKPVRGSGGAIKLRVAAMMLEMR